MGVFRGKNGGLKEFRGKEGGLSVQRGETEGNLGVFMKKDWVERG